MPKLLRDLKSFYAIQNRAHLPWRKTRDPYKILVSEMMLQQTQVDRVVPFYERFIAEFPTAAHLAKAPLHKVLKAWQGLGYNRRAKFLWESANLLSKRSSGLLSRAALSGAASRARPFSREAFALKLPGVGAYTAAAVEAFAYNKPTVFVETNIRTVFLHHFFHSNILQNVRISDKEILPLVEEALRKSKMQPRHFYAALMDYGSYLKKRGVKLNAKSKHYTKQSKFEGSYRQLRGAILRALLNKSSTVDELIKITSRKKADVLRVIANLSGEGMITIKNKRISIAE